MPSIPFSGLGTDTRAIGAALSRQLGVALLMLCWSFSLHAVSRGRRDALQALPAPPPTTKGGKTAQNEVRSTKTLSAWFKISVEQCRRWRFLPGVGS